MFQCQQVLGIPYKKTSKRQVGYLSEDETKTLLAMPDTETRKGRRDQAMLTLLYDSGARVQELADLRVGDLRCAGKTDGQGKKNKKCPSDGQDNSTSEELPFRAAFRLSV